jgi:hypothetical protein
MNRGGRNRRQSPSRRADRGAELQRTGERIVGQSPGRAVGKQCGVGWTLGGEVSDEAHGRSRARAVPREKKNEMPSALARLPFARFA